MSDKPQSGELFGIPYNFQKPSLGRMMSSYWQPDEGFWKLYGTPNSSPDCGLSGMDGRTTGRDL